MTLKIPVSQILTETRDLLSDASRWTKEQVACDANGFGVHVNSEAACRWCLVGGVMKVLANHGEVWGDGDWDRAYTASREALATTIGRSGISVANWNDQSSRTHDEVISLLNATIEIQRECENNQ